MNVVDASYQDVSRNKTSINKNWMLKLLLTLLRKHTHHMSLLSILKEKCWKTQVHYSVNGAMTQMNTKAEDANFKHQRDLAHKLIQVGNSISQLKEMIGHYSITERTTILLRRV